MASNHGSAHSPTLAAGTTPAAPQPHGAHGTDAHGHEADAHGAPPPAQDGGLVLPPTHPVDISRRSDRENLFILVLVVLGLIWLLSQAADLKEMKTRDDPPAPKSGRPIR